MNRERVWLSLIERLVWDQEAAGSNPVTPIPDNNRNPYCDLRV